MRRVRIIPVLLLRDRGVVKTVKFKNAKYVGDSVNAIKLFNEKEVDEIVVLDIDASPQNREPDVAFVKELAGECFMPMSYGGGIRSVDQAKAIFDAGVEKVILNTVAGEQPSLVKDIASRYGSSSVVVSIDVKKNWLGRNHCYVNGGSKKVNKSPLAFAREMQEQGAGEIILNSIDRDGTFTGFDTPLIKSVADQLDIPVVACGGASKMEDFLEVIKEGHASAAAAGSFFVFKGIHRAVLINYPQQAILKEQLYHHL